MANKRNTTRNYANTKKTQFTEQVEPEVKEETTSEEVLEAAVEPEVEKEVEASVPVKHFAKVAGVKTGLRLRNRPSTESDVLSILKPNQDNIEIIENLGKWTKVQVDVTVGYVMTEFIEEV